jgi:hypothetical protein
MRKLQLGNSDPIVGRFAAGLLSCLPDCSEVRALCHHTTSTSAIPPYRKRRNHLRKRLFNTLARKSV